VGQLAVEAEVTLVERLPIFRRRARAPSEERRRDARGGHVPLAACQPRPGPLRIRRRCRQYRRAATGNWHPLQLLLLLYPQRALRYRCPLQRDFLRSFLKSGKAREDEEEGEEEREIIPNFRDLSDISC